MFIETNFIIAIQVQEKILSAIRETIKIRKFTDQLLGIFACFMPVFLDIKIKN